MTVSRLYEEQIKSLPATEQLQLAALILSRVVPPVVNDSGGWSDEDIRGAAAYSLSRALPLFPIPLNTSKYFPSWNTPHN